jgi:hypothetical protein
MVFVFILGMVAGLAAPIFVRWAKAGGVTLAGAAALLVVAALTGVLNPDPREGLAAIEANRREYLFVLGCEVPVLAFALLSGEQRKKLFWLGWGIHTAFTACVAAVVIWLRFFWHW